MRAFIPITLHGILDYVEGLLLATSPWLFGFVHLGGAALFIPLFLGCILLLLTIFTNYKPGIVRVVPLELHLVADVLVGFIIFISPFLWQFAEKGVYLPHLILGLVVMGSGILTVSSPLLSPVDRNTNRSYGITSNDAG